LAALEHDRRIAHEHEGGHAVERRDVDGKLAWNGPCFVPRVRWFAGKGGGLHEGDGAIPLPGVTRVHLPHQILTRFGRGRAGAEREQGEDSGRSREGSRWHV